MKNLILFSVLFSFLCGCKKDNAGTTKTADEVTYEVILVNSATWHGAYINENAQIISVTGEATNWKYTFKNTKGLALAQLDAYADGLAAGADALMKIYVNGNVKASGTSSISPRVMYIFP